MTEKEYVQVRASQRNVLRIFCWNTLYCIVRYVNTIYLLEEIFFLPSPPFSFVILFVSIHIVHTYLKKKNAQQQLKRGLKSKPGE